jgi:hypothetical protein
LAATLAGVEPDRFWCGPSAARWLTAATGNVCKAPQAVGGDLARQQYDQRQEEARQRRGPVA